MKRIIRVVIICAFLLTSFGVVPGLADPAGPWPIFIPMLARSPAHFTVSGTVRDSNNYTVAGATIMDKNGLSTVTDIQGNYSLSVDQGPNTLSATRNGYAMAPLSINVASNLAGVNFNAQVGCGNIVTNEQVNVGMGGWSFLSDHAGDVDPGTDTLIFRSPPSSGRVGINVGVDSTIASTTRARSQLYRVPSDADEAFLGVWLNQVDTGADFDTQSIYLLDKNNDEISQLYFTRDFSSGWTYHEFPLGVFKGQDIKIEFRVVNDGGAFTSTMYFDDVSLVICNTHCDNQVINSDFETRDGWLYNAEAIINPWYVNNTVVPPHSGTFSMQTGIPISGTLSMVTGLTYFDLESSSEVWQRNIDLPADQSLATLTFWIYRTRVEGIVPPGAPPAELNPANYLPAIADSASRGPFSLTATPPEDWVYLYVYDDAGNFLKKPLWQRATNDAGWMLYWVDLSAYMGQQIELLFGTYNDGKGGPSAMFVDDVVIGTCK